MADGGWRRHEAARAAGCEGSAAFRASATAWALSGGLCTRPPSHYSSQTARVAIGVATFKRRLRGRLYG